MTAVSSATRAVVAPRSAKTRPKYSSKARKPYINAVSTTARRTTGCVVASRVPARSMATQRPSSPWPSSIAGSPVSSSASVRRRAAGSDSATSALTQQTARLTQPVSSMPAEQDQRRSGQVGEHQADQPGRRGPADHLGVAPLLADRGELVVGERLERPRGQRGREPPEHEAEQEAGVPRPGDPHGVPHPVDDRARRQQGAPRDDVGPGAGRHLEQERRRRPDHEQRRDLGRRSARGRRRAARRPGRSGSGRSGTRTRPAVRSAHRRRAQRGVGWVNRGVPGKAMAHRGVVTARGSTTITTFPRAGATVGGTRHDRLMPMLRPAQRTSRGLDDGRARALADRGLARGAARRRAAARAARRATDRGGSPRRRPGRRAVAAVARHRSRRSGGSSAAQPPATAGMTEICVPSGVGGVEVVEEPHVVVADVDVDEPADLPGLVEDAPLDAGVAAVEARRSPRPSVPPSALTSDSPPV